MLKETVCLVMKSMESLTEKEIGKLHHYLGHCSVDKPEKLITNADRMKSKPTWKRSEHAVKAAEYSKTGS
jgi:hypothetical protein